MFLARVSFLGPEKGGRSGPAMLGYHPQIDVGDEYTSCAIESLDDETTFEFDREYTVRLRLLLPEVYGDRITVGSTHGFYEGSHLVASGTILAVLE